MEDGESLVELGFAEKVGRRGREGEEREGGRRERGRETREEWSECEVSASSLSQRRSQNGDVRVPRAHQVC